MKIKNLTVKPLGFGSTVILPDDTGTLPKGYDKSHPTVKYYFSRKWIKEIGGRDNENGGASSVKVDINTGSNGTDGDGNEGGADNGMGGESGNTGTGNGTGGTNKSLDRMNKEELQAVAFARGVQFVEADTKSMLIEKIKAAQNGNE